MNVRSRTDALVNTLFCIVTNRTACGATPSRADEPRSGLHGANT